jgi:signal peptidase II
MPLARTLIVAVLVLILDQFTKYWVVEHLDLETLKAIDVWPPYLNFRMAWNQGINFGVFDMGHSGRWVLIGLSSVISLAILLWIRKKPGWFMPFCAGLVVGGAIGNVWDRLTYGAVADFLNMSCCGIDNPYAFNVADIAIFAGAFGLILFADGKKT